MTPTIDIYNVDGSVLMTAVVTKNGERRESLMTEDCILLKWSAADYIMLPEGAYISWDDGERYRLVNPYYPAQKNELRCEYAPEFFSRVMCWSTVPLFFYTYAADGKTVTSRETDWTLTGSPADFMAYFARVIREETGEAWNVTVSDDIPVTSATVKFESTDVLSGINSVASAFGTEWRADKGSNTLHLGAAAHGVPVRLAVGGNVSVPSTSMSKAEYGNRYYVFGSSRNITQTYEGANVNNLVTRRLTLDPAKYPGGYIDTRQGLKAGEIVPRFLTFDDVYPRSALEAYDVRCRLVYRLDEAGDKIQVGTDGEGQPLYDQYAVWYFKARDKVTGVQYLFDIADQIKGQALSVSFLGGALNGRDFELTYHDKSKVVNTSDGTPLQVDKGDFEINFVEEGGYIIPAVTAMVPKDGDALSLFNINMPSEYHASAYLELETAALAEINRRQKDLNNYEISSNPVEFYNNDPELTVGQNVIFVNVDGKEIHTRVLSIVRKLDRPCEQKITLGNELVKGTMSEIKDEVVNANSNLSILAQLQQLNTAFTQAYTRTQQQLLEGMAQMSRLWYLDEDGNVCTDRNVCSAKDIVALGKKSAGIGGGGNGGGASALWELTDVDVADAANGDIIVYNSATQKWINVSQSSLRPDLSDYATRVWVQSQGYLTQHQSLADYATRAWVEAQKYVTASALDLYLPLTGGTLTGPLTMGGDGVHRIYFADAEHYIELDAEGNFHFSHNVYSDEDIVALGSKSWNGGAFGGSLADLSDVKLSNLAVNDLIQWNGTDWVNVKASELGVGSGNVDLTAYLKVDGSNGTASGVSALIRALGAAAAEVKDDTLIVTSDNEGQTEAKPNYYRRSATAFWQYILNKDGSGSGLDADLLDGLHAGSFTRQITMTHGNLSPTAYIKLGTLPVSSNMTGDSITIEGFIGDFRAAVRSYFSVTLGRRDGLKIKGWYQSGGESYMNIGVNSNGEVYLICYQQYVAYSFSVKWGGLATLDYTGTVSTPKDTSWTLISSAAGVAKMGTGSLLDTANYATTLDGRYVKKAGDTMTGNLTLPRLNIVGSASSSAYLTSDSSANVFFNVSGKSLLVLEGGSADVVRASRALGGAVSLGDSTTRWSNVYATTINVSSTALVSNLNADMLDGLHESSFYRSTIKQLDYTKILTTLPGNRSGGYTTNQPNWTGAVFVLHAGGSNSAIAFYRPGGGNGDPHLFYNNDNNANWVDKGTILLSGNYTGYLDDRYVKKSGDTMSGVLGITRAASDDSAGYTQGFIYRNTGGAKPYIHIGYGTGGKNNGTNIGFCYKGENSTSNYLFLGFSANNELMNLTAAGNLGIGTTTPSNPLHVNGVIRSSGLCFFGAEVGNYGIEGRATSDYGKLGDVTGDVAMYFNFGYGAKRGWIWRRKEAATSTTRAVMSLSCDGNLYTIGDMVAANSSDRRLKQGFAIEDYADKLLRLGSVMSYEWRDMAREMDPGKYDALRHSSVVWQRARKVGIPGFCGMDEHGYGYVNWLNKDYQATLLGAVQDHERRLRAVEKALTDKCA